MAAINDLIKQIKDPELQARIQKEVDKLAKQKKFGLVFEEHLPECTPLYDIPPKPGSNVMLRNSNENKTIYKLIRISDGTATCVNKNNNEDVAEFGVNDIVRVAEFGEPIYPYLKPIDSVCNAPDIDLWHTLIEADNYHALQLLEYLYAGKVDCIYIDPPYNTGARDWKYNNDYVDNNDQYRHSKWLSMMQKRLKLAKKLLNPKDSVLIVTIDEKEYLHLGCLLEEMFPEANMQMISSVINPNGTGRENEFSRVDEYIFILQFGNMSIIKTKNNMLGNDDSQARARVWYPFSRSNNLRFDHNKQFFPIYIDPIKKTICKVGEPKELITSQEDFEQEEGLVAVFPVRDNGEECSWGAIPSTTREWIEKGFLRVGQYDKKIDRWSILYIRSGLQEKIENGTVPVSGKLEDGSINLEQVSDDVKVVSPKSVWNVLSHNATKYGTNLITPMMGGRRFSYPKSLYAVKDSILFFVANKPNALIVDFFAGSGTTLHAVNLLNAEDGGHRRCILVTNNEVSDAEAKEMSAKGLKPGDEEWEKLGIARYVTWPRTVCSIEGHDVNGNPLKGNYLGSDLPMADGFKANAAFFKLGFLDKTAVALGMQFKELLPVLWMKAGAIGKCPTIFSDKLPDMLILPKNKFAVLINENAFGKFAEEMDKCKEIQTAFLITDYEVNYRSMAKTLGIATTYQLYRDYLDNFRINYGRN